jgi:hypothetical protein
MELVEIRPMSDEANDLINVAMEEHGFEKRADAFNYLRATGRLRGQDIGGEIINETEAIVALAKEFECHPRTAKRHVVRAARRKRHPDWQPPGWGGRRERAGRKRDYIVDVARGRAIVSKYVDAGVGIMQYSAADNWHELEVAAIIAVIEQGGNLNLDARYGCPAELVSAGRWDEDED